MGNDAVNAKDLIEDRWLIAGKTYKEKVWMREWIKQKCGSVAQLSSRPFGDYGRKN